MKYWLTLANRDWAPGVPHPGYAEYEDGKPTGRVSRIAVMADSPVPPTLHSGLRRDRENDRDLRDMIEKFRTGAPLNRDELCRLLKYYGMLIRVTEIAGQAYWLAHRAAVDEHRRLLQLAAARGLSQALIDAYGVTVEGGLGAVHPK